MSYFVVCYLCVSFSGLITSFGGESCVSAIDCS